MVFDEVSNRGFVLENKSRVLTCYDLASKEDDECSGVCFEAQGEIIHFSAAYRDSKREPLRFCAVDLASNGLKLLRLDEK